MVIALLEKALRPVRRKIHQLATRGVVTLIDPNQMMQLLQVQLLNGEVLDNIEHFEGYGLTANAPDNPEVIAVSLNGRRSHTVAIAVANRVYRLKGLTKGEVALYTDEGDIIHFKRGNHIYIDAMNRITAKAPEVDIIATTKVKIDSPVIELTGALNVAGLITGQAGLAVSGGGGASITGGDLTADGISLKGHVHGGVTTGTDTTGAAQ